MDGVDHERQRQEHPAIEIDYERYQALLDDPSLSESQKRQIIDALWSIIVAFVDLGFGVHPAQAACGQLSESLDEATLTQAFSVQSKNTSEPEN